MRQVPATYLILGDGRVARHFRRYFELEELPVLAWARSHQSESELLSLVERSTHVLLLLSDRAIVEFYESHPPLSSKVCVHFSGALTYPKISGAHPLMTFADEPYSHDVYRRLPFVTESGRATFAELFPTLPNPTYSIDASQKGLYHALCALAGNFTVLLWEKAFREFHSQLGLPKSVLIPYLQQIAQNLSLAPQGASVLTGPLARGDRAVIEKHLAALKDDPFARVYEAFVGAHGERTLR